MICPTCGHDGLTVRSTSDYDSEVYRKRFCPECRNYSETVERYAKLVVDEQKYEES